MRYDDLLATCRARAASWWSTLSPRERALVGTLAAVAAIVIAVMLVVRPLQATRAAALAEIRGYEALAAGLRRAGPTLRPHAPRRVGSGREVAAASAASAGLALVGLAPSGAGVRARFARVPFDAVLRWLADLDTRSELRVRAATFTGAGPGYVSGEVLLAP